MYAVGETSKRYVYAQEYFIDPAVAGDDLYKVGITVEQ
jgi:hypothetical protein